MYINLTLATTMRLIPLLIFMSFAVYAAGQSRYDANWYFGDSAAIQFADTGIAVITNSAMHSVEGSASISDSTGNLLFYTNGHRVWNKLNQPMPHGDTLYN